MKYFASLLVALMLASCSISRDYSSANRVTLQFRDSGLKDCYLLSIHDDALLISDIDPAGLRSDVVLAHTMVLPFHSVDRIYQQKVQTFTGTFLPTIADIFSTNRAFRVNAFGSNLSAIYDAVRYSISYFTSKPISEFELSNEHDLQMLESNVVEYPSSDVHRSGALQP